MLVPILSIFTAVSIIYIDDFTYIIAIYSSTIMAIFAYLHMYGIFINRQVNFSKTKS